MRGKWGNERGSVLLLGIGLMGVILLGISVVTDASLAFLQRQALQARADAAVLAGVQAIDLDHYYSHGATEATRLVPGSAREWVRQHVQEGQIREPIPGLAVVAVDGSDRLLSAELSAPLRTAFWPISASITVRSSASLDYVG